MSVSSNITDNHLRMRGRIVRLEGEISSSTVDAIDENLSSIGHGGDRVTVTLKGVVRVDVCTCNLYA